jgi:hypothetical protein
VKASLYKSSIETIKAKAARVRRGRGFLSAYEPGKVFAVFAPARARENCWREQNEFSVFSFVRNNLAGKIFSHKLLKISLRCPAKIFAFFAVKERF